MPHRTLIALLALWSCVPSTEPSDKTPADVTDSDPSTTPPDDVDSDPPETPPDTDTDSPAEPPDSDEPEEQVDTETVPPDTDVADSDTGLAPPPSYVPLFSANTTLDPPLQVQTADALVTHLADRGRDRHAREDQFAAYDHYLPLYWEHRTAGIVITDTIPNGGTTITFDVTTQWPLRPGQEELRFFYRGLNTVAEYFNNGTMTNVGPNQYTRSIDFNPAEGRPLQVGDRVEFELSQFLDAPPSGRSNYYGTALLYVVGQGIVPWYPDGTFGNHATNREDSFPLDEAAWLGGGTTLHAATSGEPLRHYQQMATNTAPHHAQAFMRGRRIHHTDVGNGTHDESIENPVFGALTNLLGPGYGARSCVSCHEHNGRALPPNPGEPLDGYVVMVGTAQGAPDPALGRVLQPQNSLGPAEGSVTLAEWTETGTLRQPSVTFSGAQPGAYSVRIAPSLIGLGLLEAITEEDIAALADPQDLDGDGISGRIRYVTEPTTGTTRVGRFGWKAAAPTVRHQVASAFNTDMGVMTSVFPAPDCGSSQADCGTAGAEVSDAHLDDITTYLSLLGIRPRRAHDDASTLQGEQVFESVGCAACHVPTFETSEYAPFAELRSQTIHPYTDLLLHDMGPGLASTLPEDSASGAEWRTPPLWGLGYQGEVRGTVSYLHDGRARTLTEAIAWHGGEADGARQAFDALSASEQSSLLAFLESL